MRQIQHKMNEIKGNQILNLVAVFFYVFIFMNPFYSVAQHDTVAKEYVYTNFTTKDGLPSNETYCVFQDSRGYIWIGTDRGVCRYDGYEFKTYTEEDGLTDNAIFDIAEDSKGNVWFTTSNRTLCYYNIKQGIQAFKYNQLFQEVIDQNKAYFEPILDEISICNKDILYVSHRNWGYIEIPLNNLKSIKNNLYSYSECMSEDIQVELIDENEYQKLFFSGCIKGEDYNLFHINRQAKGEIRLDNINNRDVWPYVLDTNLFLIGNTTFKVGINENTFKHYKNRKHVYNIGNQYIVNEIKEYNKGPVLLVDDANNLTLGKTILNIPVRITQGIRDENGGFWLSSLEKGIFYIPDLNNRIINKDINVTGLIPSNKGVVISVRSKNYLYNLSNRNIIELNNELNIDLLYGTQTSSIQLSHQIKIKEVSDWVKVFNDANSKEISNVLIEGDTIFYIRGNGLYKFMKGQGVKILNVFLNKIYAMERVEGQFTFLACDTYIYKHFKKDDAINNSSFEYNNNSIPYITMNTKARDLKWIKNKGILAVATTGKGVFFYKGKTLLKKITFKDGLISNSVNQLYLDGEERLWIATNKGINYIEIDDKDSIHVHSYLAASRSLLSPNVQQIYGLNDSILLIGTDGGLNEIKIDLGESEYNRKFPIFITHSSVNKSLVLEPQLAYNENNIEFEFTAIEYNKYGNIDYRYRLKGLSDHWIYTKDRKASFLNLQPGTYSFELEAQNEKGKWEPSQNRSHFKINKPIWETWWFRSLILGVLGYMIYYYISKLKQEKRLLEDKQKLSEELNTSQQKALSSQLNPHFVFNSLNSIQNFILTKRTELSSDYLSMFSKLMRFVFENSKKLYVPLSDEIEALKLYLELEQVRHNNKFKFQINKESINTEEYVIPALLIQPIIENAIWHGLLHKIENDRLLEVSFTSEGEYLCINVKDNGVGRGASKPRPKFIKKQRSSGVELTKQRLDLLGQSTGLETSFELIDLFDENNNPNGTLVKVVIPKNFEM